MPHILIVDDDRDTRDWLGEVAGSEGFTVAAAETLRAARAHLVRQKPDLLLTDLQLPDGNGMDLIGDLDRGAHTEIMVITGHASVDSAVEALRLGATDYLTKPLDVDRLVNMLRRQPRTADLKHEIGELREELRRVGRFGHLYGSSAAMQSLYDKIERVAPTSATVLLTGESGTGKGLAARTIHDLSKRRRRPLLALDCGAISPHLIEGELFGYEKGSNGADAHEGLIERAEGGSVLLDELTQMSLALQVKLLRVLETGTFIRVGSTKAIATDVRIIAATSQLPGDAVSEGRFREDLFHRLSVFPIHLPPLRERGQDIEMLAQHFLNELNATEKSAKRFAPDALSLLAQHAWPGNVRELQNYVQRAYLLADSVIDAGAGTSGDSLGPEIDELITVRIGTPLYEIEERVTMATLLRCRNVKKKAAEVLGISLKTLYNRLEGYSQRERTQEESRSAETA